MSRNDPPRRAERLARWSLAPWERPAVLGDLQEEFRDLSDMAGVSVARRWYWRQSIVSIWPNLLRRLRGDECRRHLCGQGVSYVAVGLLMIAQESLLPRGRGPDSWMCGAVWMLSGAISVVDSLVRKRTSMPALKIKVLRILCCLAISGGVLISALWPQLMLQHTTQSTWTFLSLVFMIRLWPWWPTDPPPEEILVRSKADPDQNPEGLLAFDVPNVPLGLSGLVLCHAPARADDGAAPRAVHREEPTIDRAFTGVDAVRVCAVVNLVRPRARAIVDVVDSGGQVARTVRIPVSVGPLEQVVTVWDDIAADDPAEHFGQIDVTLPLADLAPGSYRLRVTAADATHTSQREEPIVVRVLREPSGERSPRLG